MALLSQPFPATVFHAHPLAENAFVPPRWWPAVQCQPQKLIEWAGLSLAISKVSLWACSCGPWSPLAIELSGKALLLKLRMYTHQNEYFSCHFPLDQVSAEPRIRTRAGTEYSIPGGFPWSLDNQLWGGGGKGEERSLTKADLLKVSQSLHVESPAFLIIGWKFLFHLFDHIASGENHGLWEGWSWIYQCWSKLSGVYRRVHRMILSTFIYVQESSIIKRIKQIMDLERENLDQNLQHNLSLAVMI